MSSNVRVTVWESVTPPTESLLMQIMLQQKLNPYTWSNRPHDIYSAHKHTFFKVIYVVDGSITFKIPLLRKEIILKKGDRIDIPPNMVHSAMVGPEGVVCLEGHRGESK